MTTTDRMDGLKAFLLRHDEIGDHQVEFHLPAALLRLAAIRSLYYFIPFNTKKRRQERTYLSVVVRNQDSPGRFLPAENLCNLLEKVFGAERLLKEV